LQCSSLLTDLHSFPTRRSSDLNSMLIRLRAMFSSDYGHWDVGVPAQLLLHSYDLVRGELLSSEEFREFMADNAIRLHGTLNRTRSEEHTSELQSLAYLVCRLLL